jgi:predicted nuclease with TOPRIM domain
MKNLADRTKIIYLVILILFIAGFGLFWLDYIGMVNLNRHINVFRSDPELVVDAVDDEPSLMAREEFEKEKQQLAERIEDMDRREAMIVQKEKSLDVEKEKLDEMRRCLDLEKKKLSDDNSRYSGYKDNVKKLAGKIVSMPPDESVKIMVNWEDPLIIDVLRQMDADAEDAGKVSITSYLITLFPKEKASRIMYLMTQL